MITLTAKIKIFDGSDNQIENIAITPSGNNISSGIEEIVGVEKQPIRPFIVGSSLVVPEEIIKRKVDYFIGGQLANSNGEFDTPYEITFTTKNSDASQITIVFDAINNQHPISITVDNKEYRYSSGNKIVAETKNDTSHKITIGNWNVPNEPLVISGIYTFLEYDANYRRLSNLEKNNIDRANIDLPTYGIYSNSGSLRINDSNGFIREYVERRIINNKTKVEIVLANTLIDLSQLASKGITQDWEYDYLNKVATCTIADNLTELQEIQHNGIPLQPNVEKSGKDIYDTLYRATPEKYGFVEFDGLSIRTQRVLNSFKTKFLYMNPDNLWAQWTKLCNATASHIFKDFSGKTIFESEL